MPQRRMSDCRRSGAGLVSFLPGEAEDLILAPAGVVGEIEDVLPRGGQVGADGEVFGVFEEAPAGGDSPAGSYTWDEPSTSSLQCGSCGDEKGGPNP